MSDVCERLHRLAAQLPTFSFPFETVCLPKNGIYILFEAGESAHGVSRIVRIGTHTGNNQLPSRLRQHFLMENKDRSIFRKNIGRALLNREQNPFLQQWELDLTTRAAKQRYAGTIDLEKYHATERRVTDYIQRSFRFATLPMDDKGQRLSLESRLISTLSRCNECGPSSNWLGLWSPKEKIRQSGLWNVNELYKEPLTLAELVFLEQEVRRALS